MLTVDELHAFAVFAEDANMTRAAKRLHLSQPAVHAQIKRLSQVLGAPLYRRAGRSLVLTREGIEVAAFARDAQERTYDLVARVRGASGDRRVILAAGAGALLHVLGAGLRAFGASWDGRLDVVTADATAAIASVADGTAHVGVAAIPTVPEELHAQRVTDVPQVLVAPRDHRLAKKRSITISDLDRERVILPPPGRPQRITLDAAFASAGIEVHAAALAVGWELVLHLVALGVGIAVVNGSVRIPRGLVSRPLRDLPRVRYLVFTRKNPRDDARALARCLATHGDAWRAV